MGWIRLGDIASKITKGTTPTSAGFHFTDTGVNFVKVESISEDGNFIVDKFAHINNECNNKLGRSQLEENDILFSIAGAIGRTAIVTKDILPANTNQALAIIRIPNGIVDYSFLMYALKSPALFSQYEKQKQGVAQINLSLQNVSDFRIPQFSLDEQRKIAAVLDKVSDLIAKRRQQLDKLDELIKARFVEMFGTEQQKKALSDICCIITDGTHQPPKFISDGIPFLFVSNIVSNQITYETEKYISEETYNELIKRTPIELGDILLSTVGSYGHPAIVKEDRRFLFQRHIAYLKPKHDIVQSQYLHAALLSNIAQRQIESKVKGVAQKTLNLSEIRKIVLPVPPMDRQLYFCRYIEQTEKTKTTISKSLEKLETLKKALMQEYFG